MNLGNFSVSLAVKDIEASKQFYEKLGFTVFGGNQAQNWLIMKNGDHVIGLFQGMFDKNILTFNPGWDSNAQKLNEFTDVRELQRQLKERGVAMIAEADEKTTGPAQLHGGRSRRQHDSRRSACVARQRLTIRSPISSTLHASVFSRRRWNTSAAGRAAEAEQPDSRSRLRHRAPDRQSSRRLGPPVIGVDGSAAMLALARERLPEHRWIHSRIESAEIDEVCDAVVCWDALFHLPRSLWPGVIANVYRWLRPGGRLMVSSGGVVEPEGDGFTDTMFGHEFYYDSLPPEQMLALLDQAGFDIVIAEMCDVPDGGRNKGKWATVAAPALAPDPKPPSALSPPSPQAARTSASVPFVLLHHRHLQRALAIEVE